MNTFAKHLILLVLMCCSWSVMANVGKVVLAVGDVKVQRQQLITLTRGAELYEGDIIKTGKNGRAQLLMIDGARIAVKPNTELALDEYKYQKPSDAPVAVDSDSSLTMSLIKGGFRTISGAIGKGEDKTKYTVKTPVATIGIRGTDYSALMCETCTAVDGSSGAPNGLYVGVTSGAIVVFNEAGELVVNQHQYAYVKDKTSSPVRVVSPPIELMSENLTSDANTEGDGNTDQATGATSDGEGSGETGSGDQSDQGGSTGTGNDAGTTVTENNDNAGTTGGDEGGSDGSDDTENSGSSGSSDGDSGQPEPGGQSGSDNEPKPQEPPVLDEPSEEEDSFPDDPIDEYEGPGSDDSEYFESGGIELTIDGEDEDGDPIRVDDKEYTINDLYRFTWSSGQAIEGTLNYLGYAPIDSQVFSANELIAFATVDSSASINYRFDVSGAEALNQGFDPTSGLTWGRWSNGFIDVVNASGDSLTIDLTNASLHWISDSSIGEVNLPINGSARYQLIGNTDPTNNLGETGILGNATFNVDFTNQTVQQTVDLSIGGSVWNAAGTGSIAAGGVFSGIYDQVVIDGALGGWGSFSGFFSSANQDGLPLGAGLTYLLTDSETNPSEIINGALIFGEPTRVP